jgi:hypothetical protein
LKDLIPDNPEIKTLFRESLQHHEGLLGILLEYGRNNAWHYYKNEHFLLKPIFYDELNQLFKNKKAAFHFTLGWPKVEMREILMYPTFMADINTEETKQLKLEHLQTREKILNFYKGKNFLEATLELLADRKLSENGSDFFQ